MELIPSAALLTVAGMGALLRGGAVERRGALMFSIAWLVALIMRSWPPGPWLFLTDLSVMIGLVALSWKSPRPWPIYACGFQMLLLAFHVAGLVHPDLEPGRLEAMMVTAGAAAIFMLVVGAWSPPRAKAPVKIK